jgi:hypothetical protein
MSRQLPADYARRIEVGSTILDQLGGRAFLRMTGAKGLSMGSTDELRMVLPIGKWRICKVQLTLNDLYTVRFQAPRLGPSDCIAEFSNVYAEDLSALFERETGLQTKLPRVRFQ